MKPRGKVSRWIEIIGLVSGVTLIIGFFIELLVLNRWSPMLAVSGTAGTVVFTYRLFYERRRLRVPPPQRSEDLQVIVPLKSEATLCQ
jgi:hypothetical protein